jgi:hypothetical protein
MGRRRMKDFEKRTKEIGLLGVLSRTSFGRICNSRVKIKINSRY